MTLADIDAFAEKKSQEYSTSCRGEVKRALVEGACWAYEYLTKEGGNVPAWCDQSEKDCLITADLLKKNGWIANPEEKFFMKQFTAENEEATNSNTFRLGMAMAILSALVYSAFAFANVAFISPDLFEGQMEAIMQQMAPMMDSNTMSVLEKYQNNLAQITFFSNLIYCFLYGIILSFILSRNIPGKDPFADYKPAE